MRHTRIACAMALTGLAFGTGARADGLDWRAYFGVEHSNNINLTRTDRVGQNVLTPGLAFGYQRQGATLNANVLGSLEYRDYPGGRFTNQKVAELAGQAAWTLLPERLDFVVADYAGVQPLDTLASDQPDNQQQTNVFAAGPVLHFGLGKTVHGQAEVRYIESHAQKTRVFDSRRSQAALHLSRDLSETKALSLNASSERVRLYHAPASPDYRRDELFAHFQNQQRQYTLNLEYGRSRVSYEQRQHPTVTRPLARFAFDWTASDHQSLTLSARRQFGDAAQDLMLRANEPAVSTTHGITTGDAVVSPEVFLERYAELAWAMRSERSTLSLAPYYRRLDYLHDTSMSQRGRGGNLGWSYHLRPATWLTAWAGTERIDYSTLARRDRMRTWGLGITNQRTPHWSWNASFSHQQRDSDVATASFRENRIYLGVTYQR